MLDKDQHIAYWAKMSEDDLETADWLMVGKRYLQALFFAHLSLEKILKALYIAANEGNVPPKTHNLVFLYQRAGIQLPDDDVNFLQAMNAFQIEGRYPDYLSALNRTTPPAEAREILEQTKVLHLCLHAKLPSNT